ncbi:MAG: FAD-dependent thymidylate synthase [Candidatus Schekmanbacteria bacterium]|nr:FAD-dependent thymidylate synthase [Candidatus Schekmanbacteria bacterium]
MQIDIIRQPRVTLVAAPQFHYPPHLAWRSDNDADGEVLAEFAGRLCYLSFGKEAGIDAGHKTVAGRTTAASYLQNILEVKHGSVLEHAVWSLLIEGVSRSLTHELVRHRAGFAFSQLSQRYVEESAVAFVLPPEIHEPGRAFETWCTACQAALAAYRELLSELRVELGGDAGVKRLRQTARAVLPNCVETKIVVSGNGRSWRHFVEMRGSPAAETEIRRLAVTVARALRVCAPNIFGDIEEADAEAGVPCLVVRHSKV